jgi:hypothetical protein
MKRRPLTALIGLILILVGVALSLEQWGMLTVSDYLWSAIFAVAGLGFLFVYLQDNQRWWAVIPAFTLFGLAGLLAWEQAAPEGLRGWSASFLLSGIGISFWIIYLSNQKQWWAIIPGGVMITIAAVTGISTAMEGVVDGGGIFLLGLGLTFALLSLVRPPHGRLRWALIPAIVLLVLGAMLTAASADVLRYAWPIALILAGAVVIGRMLLRRGT